MAVKRFETPPNILQNRMKDLNAWTNPSPNSPGVPGGSQAPNTQNNQGRGSNFNFWTNPAGLPDGGGIPGVGGGQGGGGAQGGGESLMEDPSGEQMSFTQGEAGELMVWLEQLTQTMSDTQFPSETYDSGNQTITSGAAISLTHGLSSAPILVTYHLVCLTTEDNWAVGAELPVVPVTASAGFGADEGFQVEVTDTLIEGVFGNAANTFQLLDKSAGTSSTVTNAKWAFIARAYV
jgi:hypothetical protein